MRRKVNILLILILSILLLFTAHVIYGQPNRNEDKVRKIEQEADRLFIEQDFLKAMEKYNSIFNIVPDISDEATNYLHLKMAHLYLSLLENQLAIKHFEAVMETNTTDLSPGDFCNYMDALRNTGQNEKALRIC